jgi:8-oxo-dGTP diphosphatase
MNENWLHVVAGIIQNEQGQILIAKRPPHKHQGDLWEFPGGKVEQGENVFAALQRELKEELALNIYSARSYLQIRHCYPDKNIFLDIFKVTDFSGQARGCEGQEVRWITLDQIENFEFPKANTKIVKALKVPELLSITSPVISSSAISSSIFVLATDKIETKNEHLNNPSSDALLLRLPLLNDEQYCEYFFNLHAALEKYSLKDKLKLLINRVHLLGDLKKCAGLHLSANELMNIKKRPVSSSLLFSASCHNKIELEQAEKVACDFVMLSPVFKTDSHPQAKILGWHGFKMLAESSELPILALGGMSPKNLLEAKSYGAMGVAGISNFGITV